MCSPTDKITGRPERWISLAICVPLDDAPTTKTPPSASWPGFRYSFAVRIAIDGGTRLAKVGSRATLHAPEASTTARHRQSPRSVRTRYPASVLRTEVTVVLVRSGARMAFA